MRTLVFVALGCFAASPANSQDRCSIQVLPPDHFRSVQGYVVAVDQPEGHWVGRSLVLLGSTVAAESAGLRISDYEADGIYTGIIRDSAGQVRMLPAVASLPDTMSMLWPRAVVVQDTVHVVWGGQHARSSGRARSLHYGRLVNGRWVSRDTIASGRDLFWFTPNQHLVALGDTLWLVVAEGTPARIAIFRRIDGRWSETSIPLGGDRAAYASVAGLPGRVVIVFAGIRLTADRRGIPTVSATASTDGGSTWSDFVHLNHGHPGHTSNSNAVSVADSAIVVTWGQASTEAFHQESVLTAVYTPQTGWTRGPSLEAPEIFRALRTIADHQGLWAAIGLVRRQFVLYRFENRTWARYHVSLPEDLFAPPTLAIAPDGRLQLFWSVVGTVGSRQVPILHSAFAERCNSPPSP